MSDELITPSRETTVLICDDNVAMRTMLSAIVELIPDTHVIGEAVNGELAISEASRLQPDVILLDLAMPVLSGLDALPKLRQSATAAQIIVLSGFSSETVADQVLALGADGYLEKGADLETLIDAIEQVAGDMLDHGPVAPRLGRG
jgi:DNA-binding NarL/FixJ family response regulator